MQPLWRGGQITGHGEIVLDFTEVEGEARHVMAIFGASHVVIIEFGLQPRPGLVYSFVGKTEDWQYQEAPWNSTLLHSDWSSHFLCGNFTQLQLCFIQGSLPNLIGTPHCQQWLQISNIIRRSFRCCELWRRSNNSNAKGYFFFTVNFLQSGRPAPAIYILSNLSKLSYCKKVFFPLQKTKRFADGPFTRSKHALPFIILPKYVDLFFISSYWHGVQCSRAIFSACAEGARGKQAH